jgi:hypothetical protein
VAGVCRKRANGGVVVSVLGQMAGDQTFAGRTELQIDDHVAEYHGNSLEHLFAILDLKEISDREWMPSKMHGSFIVRHSDVELGHHDPAQSDVMEWKVGL